MSENDQITSVRLTQLTCLGSVPDSAVLMGVTVSGQINELTEVRVRVSLPATELRSFLDTKIEVSLFTSMSELTGSTEYAYGGVIFEAREVDYTGDGDIVYDLAAYSDFRKSCYGRRYAIFEQRTTNDVITQIVGNYALGEQVNLPSAGDSLEHRFQFLETDWEFFNRLMQRNGLNFCDRHVHGGSSALSIFAPGSSSFPSFKKAFTLYVQEHLTVRAEPAQNLPYGHPHGAANAVERWGFASQVRRGIASVEVVDQDYLDNNARISQTRNNAGELASESVETDVVFPSFATEVSDSTTAAYASGRLARANDAAATIVVECDLGTVRVGDGVTLVGADAYPENKEFMVVRQQLTVTVGEMHNTLTLADPSYVGPGTNFLNPRYRGLLTGRVTSPAKDDPRQLGRIKVKLPIVEAVESFWCRVARPFAGPARGIQFDADIDDEVLIGFLHDDPDRPTIIGYFHHGGNDQPFVSEEFGGDYVAGIKMQSENEFSFHEQPGSEQIYKHAIKDALTEVDNDDTHDIGNNLKITVGGTTDLTSTGAITISSNASIELKVGGSSIKIEAGGVKINGSGEFEAKGGGTAKVESGGMTEIKGSLVKIN